MLLVTFALLILVGVPLFFLLYNPPNCLDGRRNGDETGVDCGGSCQLLCTAESLPLIIKGDPRVLEISPNTFSAVALVENPNQNGEVYKARYVMRIYDAITITPLVIPLKIIEGETYIPSGTTFAIFEGPFVLGEGVVPTKATLEWKKESLVWERNKGNFGRVQISNSRLSGEDTSPRLDVVVENVSLESVSNIELTALISNEEGNIFAASKSYISTLSMGGSAPAIFTWPEPFTETAFDIDIVLRVFPDGSFLR